MTAYTLKEQQQERQLARMRRLATGLLVLMAVIFLGAHLMQPRFPWLAYVAAFAEAAMVGALADWFAVTALFRTPLGLPIPHTAIIPRNKDRIGASVANFLEYNFLTKDVIASELQAIDFADVVARWLVQPANSRAVSLQAMRLLPPFLRMVEEDDIGHFLQDRAAGLLVRIRFAPFAAEILSILVAEAHHQVLFDYLIGLGARALAENKPLIRQKIHERSPRWMPKAIDDRFYNSLIEELEAFLAEMAGPESDWRRRFENAVDSLVIGLRGSPELEARIAGFIAETIDHPQFQSWSKTLWRDIKFGLLTDARSEDSVMAARTEQALRAFGEAVAQDAPARARLNDWLRGFATEVIVARRSAIADLVRRVIQTWDAETVARKFELYVGRDLQYIRINGTLVGGMVGLLLYLVTRAI